MSKIYILVVLYKKQITESDTLMSLQVSQKPNINCELIIWDNSPYKQDFEQVAILSNTLEPWHLSYRWDGKNHYLSQIYNTVISECDDDSILIILDHDSKLPANYLKYIENITMSSETSNVNLFLPIVFSHDKIVSPAYETKFRHKLWENKKIGIISSENLTAINSGMVIRSKYLKGLFPGYNEKLRFYETDNDFMRKYRLQNESAFIMDLCINHSLNFIEDDVASKISRFQAMKEGRLIVAKEYGKSQYFIERLRFAYLAIKYAITYKSFSFFR